MSKPNENKSLGFNLYEDRQGRKIYHDPLNKKAYYISRDNERKFFIYTGRAVIPFMIGFVVYYFYPNILLAGSVTVITYLIMVFFFRTMFLTELSICPHFVPGEKASLISGLANSYSISRLAGIVIISASLSVLSLINALNSDYAHSDRILNLVLTIVTMAFAVIHLMALLRKRKPDNGQ